MSSLAVKIVAPSSCGFELPVTITPPEVNMLPRYFFVAILSCSLVGCADPMYQQSAVASPSVSEIQGGCFASRKKFLDQTACIETGISSSALNPYAQEYLAYMQSLATKVKAGKLSGNDARVKLTAKLNELRALQQNQLTIQEQLDMQRAAHNAEVLRQYQANQQRINEAYPTYVPVQSSPIIVNQTPQYQVPPIQTYQPPKPTVTECHGVGNQMVCTSGESKY